MTTICVKCLVMFGPSGSGKSTLLTKLFHKYNDIFRFSVSHTTRNPRVGEIDGKDYHFINKQSFEQMITENKFIEFTKFSDNYYGTTFKSLETVLQSKRIPVFDVEIEGVISLRKLLKTDANYVFIKPKSLEFLEKNLRNRQTESEKSLKERLKHAENDLILAEEKMKSEKLFDKVIVNEEIEVAFTELETFLKNDISEVQKVIQNEKHINQ